MKAYLVTTGILFTLIVAVHLLRLAEEGAHVIHDPWFIGLTVLAAGLSIWAWRLFVQANKAT